MTVGAGTDMDEVNIGPETWPETVAASAAAAALASRTRLDRKWPDLDFCSIVASCTGFGIGPARQRDRAG